MLKCTKFDFGSAPDPTGGAYSAPPPPDPPSWIKGVLLLRGREGKGRGEGKDRGGEEREGRGEKGRGGERREGRRRKGRGREGRRPFW